jgi:Uma2 family endonuclease
MGKLVQGPRIAGPLIKFRSIAVTNIDGGMTMSTITPTQPITSPAGPAAPAFADVYRMDVDEFERVADLLKAERVELIDGFIVERGAMDPPHVLSSEKLRRKLDRMLPGGWIVREDKPVQVHRTYEPLPDLAVVEGDPDTYENRHPVPADVAILIEISDATLTRDRGEKQVNYARGGISIYWIVNLIDRQVEVYTGPSSDGYSSCIIFKPGQSIPVVIDGVELGQIAVAEILPRTGSNGP